MSVFGTLRIFNSGLNTDHSHRNGGRSSMTDESFKVVSTADEADHDIYAHEVRTNTNFTIYRRNKGFSSTDTIDYKAHKIWWEDGKADDRCKINTNGCPYIILGYDVRECQHGPDRNIKKKIQYQAEKVFNEEKSKTDHSYVMKGRTLIQNTKKMICPARITQRRIIKFPGYRLENSSSKWRRKQTAKTLRKALEESSADVVKEEEIHMYYPTADDHKNHIIGEFAGLCQPVGPEVKAKIRELVGDGVTKVSEMKRHLKVFVKKELEIEDQTIPSRRFYPTDKDIRNHMDATKNKFRFSKDDQTNLEHLVQGWTKTFPDDNFYLRTCLHGPEDKTSDEKFVFVHQSRWQKRLLNLYGKEICLLDATYNTSKYDLPLFFICVNTNVGYINVATFITADELAESIKEALQKIMQWNEDWNPPYFMTDNDSCEISAIEESLPGCQVYLCDFHKEQAWDRWLKKQKNGCTEAKEELKKLFRALSSSTSLDEYHEHVLELTTHRVWQNNQGLRNWFEPWWLGHRERWVRHFRDDLFNIRVNTTNGLERQHLRLKKDYLAETSDTSLSSLLSIIIHRFLPASYERYTENNVRSLEGYRTYADFIPKFLHNRPTKFVSHCLSRMPPSVLEIPLENFTAVGDWEFIVQSVDSDNVYTINLKKPECSCMDFQKNHLPCKHILSVIHTFPNCNWNSLPSGFKNYQNFTVDCNIVEACNTNLIQETNQNTSREKIITRRTVKTKESLTRCLELMKKMETSLYNIPHETLDELIPKLEGLALDIDQIIPTDHGLPVRLEKSRSNLISKGHSKKKKIIDKSVYANELTGVEIDEIQVLERVKGIWDQEEETGYIVAKVFNINITDGDIRSLRDKNWLTDQVMDAYLGCLANWENDQHRKVFRIPTAAMTKILNGECSINTTLQNVHLMDYDILLGAYYQDGAHWDLMIIEPMTGSLYFYNPLGESAGQKNNILLNWRMFIERRIMIGLEMDKNMTWNTIPKQHSKQHDGSSCGVYVLMFAERHLRNEQLTDIGPYEIKLGRKRIANKLLWFEVYLCDCCPVCGFMIQDDQEMEKCRLCKRSFHKTPFCMGNQHHLLADRFECRQCLVNTWTKENSCQNALKSGKRKSEQNLTAEVAMGKISKQDQKSPIEVCFDILQSNGFHEDACTTFIHNLSCIDWHISWESIVEIFAKVRTCVPDVADNIITCSKSRSLGHFGDGYIDYIPLKFKRDHIFPADMEGSGTWTLFRSVSILFYGDEAHMQFARLLTICNEIIEIGKGCDSDDHQKDLILEEMKKEFDSPCCDMEDELAVYHLMHIPNALNLNIQIHKEGASVYYEGQNGKRSISILALQKVGDQCLSFLPFMEGIFLNDRKISDRDKCGAGVFCQGNSLYKKCLKCFQTYHSSCIISQEEAFVCGCHIRRPYHPKDLNIYKDEVRFIETLDMVDIKKLCNKIRRTELPSFRWNVFRQFNSKKRKDVKTLNCLQFIPSEKIYIELRNKISSKGAVKENDEKLLDVFLPEVMVSFVMMVEGLNRFQSELFLRTDLHKLMKPSSE